MVYFYLILLKMSHVFKYPARLGPHYQSRHGELLMTRRREELCEAFG